MNVDTGSSRDLRGVLVSAFGHAAVSDLFAKGRSVSFAVGETIYAAGEAGQSCILIDDGRVEVSTMSLSGRKSVLAHMGPGELLGEIAALDGGARSADAVAATVVRGRSVARANLLDFIATRPDLAKAVIVALCQKARNASDMFVTQTTPEAEVRLARALLRLFDGWGEIDGDGALTLTERFSQQDLGAFCGLARENVNRQIKAWTVQGLLDLKGRRLVLLDRDGLEDLSETG